MDKLHIIITDITAHPRTGEPTLNGRFSLESLREYMGTKDGGEDWEVLFRFRTSLANDPESKAFVPLRNNPVRQWLYVPQTVMFEVEGILADALALVLETEQLPALAGRKKVPVNREFHFVVTEDDITYA